MPKMGNAMEEGTLLKWLKSEGQDVPVGEAIAFIQGEGEEVPERNGSASGEAEQTEGGGEGGEAQAQTTTETEAPEEEGVTDAQADGRADGHFRASPIVRRLAEENDLDLAKIDGSGPAGRIVERDVRAAMESGTAQRTEDGAQEDGVSAPEQPQAEQAEMQGFQPARLPEPTEEPGTQLVEPTRMMQVIGERMTEAQQHIPHFYATVEVRMDAAMALRKQLNEQLEAEGLKLSVNDFVMKACAVALRDYPNLNALYTTRGVELHEKVDMAMAVALDAGLITPVIRDIGSKGLAAISRESKDLAQRAREGGLTPEEYQGGTITVSNMGMFGVESFTAIINPPQAAIVAVSGIVKRPTYDEDGELAPASMMKLTLSGDHRIANGRDGALYMAEVKRILENPMLLLV